MATISAANSMQYCFAICLSQNPANKTVYCSLFLSGIHKVPQKNPFVIKYEMEIPDCGDWERCTDVLDKREKLVELMKGW